jgi:hypothetical protein
MKVRYHVHRDDKSVCDSPPHLPNEMSQVGTLAAAIVMMPSLDQGRDRHFMTRMYNLRPTTFCYAAGRPICIIYML